MSEEVDHPLRITCLIILPNQIPWSMLALQWLSSAPPMGTSSWLWSGAANLYESTKIKTAASSTFQSVSSFNSMLSQSLTWSIDSELLRILVFLIQIFLSWYQILERSITLSLRYSYYSPYQDKLSLIFWSRLMTSFLSLIMTSYSYQPMADSPLISYHTIQLWY